MPLSTFLTKSTQTPDEPDLRSKKGGQMKKLIFVLIFIFASLSIHASEMKIGDVVQLKSGSPQMTIVEITEEEDKIFARCEWFAEGNFYEKEFSIAALIIIQTEPEEIVEIETPPAPEEKQLIEIPIEPTEKVEKKPQELSKIGFGFKGGANIASLIGDDVEDYDAALELYDIDRKIKPGLIGGLFLTIRLSNFFSIQPELLYTSKGYVLEPKSYVGLNGKEVHNFSYVELPILVKLHTPPKEDGKINSQAGIYAGIAPGLLIIDRWRLTDELSDVASDLGFPTSGDISDDYFNVTKYDLSFIFGAEFYISSFLIDARYNLGLVEFIDETGSTALKHGVFSIMAGFRFQ